MSADKEVAVSNGLAAVNCLTEVDQPETNNNKK